MAFMSSRPALRDFVLLALVLASHIVPTIVIGFGFVIPGSCIAGVNEHTLGFVSAIVGFVVTFTFGVLLARRLARAQLLREIEAGVPARS